MPISTDTTRLSIDFAYEWEAPDGSILTYQMKFMHGPWGPVVQISTNGESVEFPAEMFTETSDFLISQGVMRGKTPVPVLGRGGGALAVPTISKKEGSKGPMGMGKQAKKPPVANVPAFHSMESEGDEDDGSVEMAQEGELTVKKKFMMPEDRPPLTGKEGVTPDEAEEMLQQRMKAKAEAKAAEKSLASKKRHAPEGS